MKKIISILTILILVIGLNFAALKIIMAQNGNDTIETEQIIEEGALPEEKIEISDDIKSIVPQQDFIDSFCYTLKWRSMEIFNIFNVGEKLFQEAKNKVEEVDIILSFPDIAVLKSEIEQKINNVCNATTVDDAILALKNFLDFFQNNIKRPFEIFHYSIENSVKTKWKELQQEIDSQLEELVENKKIEIEEKIRQEVIKEQEALQQEMTEKIQKGELSSEDAQNQIQQKIQERTEELIKKEKQEMLKKLKDSEILKSKPQEVQKFKELSEFFKDFVQKLRKAKKTKNPQFEKFKKMALEKRKNIVFKILDKKINEAIEQIKDAKDDLEKLKKINPATPTADELINEIQNDAEILKTKLSESTEKNNNELFEKLINDFRIKWEDKKKKIEQGQNAKIICSFVIDKIENAKNRIQKTINQLTEAKKNCRQREDIEQCNKFNKNIDLVDKFISKLNQILSLVNEVENICNQISESAPSDRILKILNDLKKQETEINFLKEKFNNLIK